MANSSSGGTGQLSVVDWLLCIFCGPIGCIVGIVALIKGDTSRGIKMIVISIVVAVVANIVSFVAQMALQQ